MMLDVAGAWRRAEPDQRIRLQNLLFQNGLNYSDQSHDFGQIKPSLFSVMQETVAVGDGKQVGVQTFRQNKICKPRRRMKSLNTLTLACSMRWRKILGKTGGWRPRRDLNPCYRRESTGSDRKLLKLRDTDGYLKRFQ